MAPIKFAKIRFKNEKDLHTVSVSDIKEKVNEKWVEFKPLNLESYKKNVYYKVKWECQDQECEFAENQHCHNWKANIVCLGESIKQLNLLCNKQRIKFAIMDSTTTSVEDTENEISTAAPTPEKSESSVTAKLNKALLEKMNRSRILAQRSKINPHNPSSSKQADIDERNYVEQSNNLSFFIDDECTSNVGMNQNERSIHDELFRSDDRLTGQSETQANENHTQRNRSSNTENRRQPASNLIRSIKKKYQCTQSENINLYTEGERFSVKDGEIYLGLDVFVDEESWELLQLQKRPQIYLRDLADMLWTPKKLVNRCFKLNAIKVTSIIPGSPRKKLENDRLLLLRELYKDCLVKSKMSKRQITYCMANVNNVLKQKIQDLRKHYT